MKETRWWLQDQGGQSPRLHALSGDTRLGNYKAASILANHILFLRYKLPLDPEPGVIHPLSSRSRELCLAQFPVQSQVEHRDQAVSHDAAEIGRLRRVPFFLPRYAGRYVLLHGHAWSTGYAPCFSTG